MCGVCFHNKEGTENLRLREFGKYETALRVVSEQIAPESSSYVIINY